MTLHEFSSLEPGGSPYPDKETPRLELIKGLITEADMVEATDDEERLAETAPAPAESTEETRTEYRTREERELELYQKMARAKVPRLIERVINHENPEPQRHRIEGELGRKGRRGL